MKSNKEISRRLLIKVNINTDNVIAVTSNTLYLLFSHLI